MKPDAHSSPERGNRSLSDARRQLGRAIGDALSGSLGALSERLRGNGAAEASRAAAKSKYRLQEVLSTDRSNVGLAELTTALDFTPDAPQPSAAESASVQANESGSLPAEVIALASTHAPSPDAIAVPTAPLGAFANAPVETTANAPNPSAAQRAQADTSAAAIEPSVTIAPVMMIAAAEPSLAATPAASAAVSAEPPVRTSQRAPSRPPPSAAAEPEPSVWDEPIRTRSMARLLASQGHHQRALAIYDLLLSSNAADASLRAEVDALRGQLLSA